MSHPAFEALRAVSGRWRAHAELAEYQYGYALEACADELDAALDALPMPDKGANTEDRTKAEREVFNIVHRDGLCGEFADADLKAAAQALTGKEAAEVLKHYAAGEFRDRIATMLQAEKNINGEWFTVRDLREHGQDWTTELPSPPDGWQPIATAPKDASWIIGQLADDEVCRVHWASDLSGSEQPAFHGWFRSSGSAFVECNPLRWMPLPSPPQPPRDAR